MAKKKKQPKQRPIEEGVTKYVDEGFGRIINPDGSVGERIRDIDWSKRKRRCSRR